MSIGTGNVSLLAVRSEWQNASYSLLAHRRNAGIVGGYDSGISGISTTAPSLLSFRGAKHVFGVGDGWTCPVTTGGTLYIFAQVWGVMVDGGAVWNYGQYSTNGWTWITLATAMNSGDTGGDVVYAASYGSIYLGYRAHLYVRANVGTDGWGGTCVTNWGLSGYFNPD